MTRVLPGDPAPWFSAPTHRNPTYAFSSVAGRYVLLVFLPREDGPQRRIAFEALDAARPLLGDGGIVAFGVIRDPETFAALQEGRGLRWFLDAEGAVSRLYGALTEAGEERPYWVLLDPGLRALSTGPLHRADAILPRLRALPDVDDHAGAPLHAPVLLVPRVLEAELCRRLIVLYEESGGAPSGTMREVDGRTVPVLDDFKKRRDATIEDPALRTILRARIERRLLPEIRRAFQFEATRLERYIVACYDAHDGGYFRPHRDNTTAGTAHRRFAVSINLNAEDFVGGDLRFPEFGRRTYRPPTGGAVVFSCSLLHEATPVTQGRRYAFLPFLYDEAGEQIRQRNRHLLDPAPAQPERHPQSAGATS